MLYVYNCPRCMIETDVYKPLADIDLPEVCPDAACEGTLMERVMSAVGINTSNCQFDTHFSPAFGKVMKSKGEIQNEIRRIKGETGKEIVEVGNDSLKSVKIKRKPYTID